MIDKTNMPSYSIEHPSWPGMVAVAVYELPWVDQEGRRIAQLRQLTFNDSSVYNYIHPVTVRVPGVIQWREGGLAPEFGVLTGAGCVVKNITTNDLSFGRFWAAYGYKVGNKATVEKKWNALQPEDRLLALQGISRQRRHSESHRTDMPYPQTYIDQRRWENVFSN